MLNHVEGERAPRESARGFLEFVDMNLEEMEEVNRIAHASGGSFLEAQNGRACEIFPARDEGVRPVDTDDDIR